MIARADFIGRSQADTANATGVPTTGSSKLGASRDGWETILQYSNHGTDVPDNQVAQQQTENLLLGHTGKQTQPASDLSEYVTLAAEPQLKPIVIVEGAAEALAGHAPAVHFEPAPHVNSRIWDDRFKRLFDVAAGLAALIVLAPLLLVLAVLVFVLDPGSVMFSQQRIGKGGKSFACYKFRSMTTNADKVLEAILACDPEARSEWERIHKLTNDPRVTKFGKFLRISSMDELPQLFNVIKGDMSLIGPRPIVGDECARYGRHFAAYTRVKPGLTGLWQVSGRNLTTYRRRIALDAFYAKNVSFKLDLLILLRTFPAVLSQRGVA